MLNYVLFSFKTIRNLLLYLKFIVYITLTYNILYKTYILISVIFIFYGVVLLWTPLYYLNRLNFIVII